MMHFTLFDSGAQRHNITVAQHPSCRSIALMCLHKGIIGSHIFLPTLSIKVLEDRVDYVGDLPSKERRNGVAHLDILLGPVAEEGIVVWKGLQPGSLAHGQAAAL
jgi:hypothetical protein